MIHVDIKNDQLKLTIYIYEVVLFKIRYVTMATTSTDTAISAKDVGNP